MVPLASDGPNDRKRRNRVTAHLFAEYLGQLGSCDWLEIAHCSQDQRLELRQDRCLSFPGRVAVNRLFPTVAIGPGHARAAGPACRRVRRPLELRAAEVAAGWRCAGDCVAHRERWSVHGRRAGIAKGVVKDEVLAIHEFCVTHSEAYTLAN